jgi:hypothetical protein
MDYVRILDSGGADCINIGSAAYLRQPDMAFYIEREHADSLLGHPGSGAYLAPEDYVSPTSSPEGLVISLIRGMAPGEVKRALLGALTALSLKALRPCPA